MKATEQKLVRFLEGYNKSFVVPVYQRNYDWNKEHCKQLFDDLEDVIANKRASHFFGTIFCQCDEDRGDGREFVVIDGQQRITTVSLLMLALIRVCEDNGRVENIDDHLIMNEYLMRKDNKEEKIRLKLVKNDAAAFSALFDGFRDKFVTPSNITNNYSLFKRMISNSQFKLTDLWSAIKKLDIVEIQLTSSDDDPQLIFESLNSKGLDLSVADKSRNFILMRLDSKTQEAFYENYWNKIEELTKYKVSDFLGNFLAFKYGKFPSKTKIYAIFKAYAQSGKSAESTLKEHTESVLGELRQFAGYYNSIIESKHNDKAIATALGYLNRLGITVVYPFLLGLLDDSRKGILRDGDLLEILSLIESFIVRRMICDIPPNALNKLFPALGRSIKKADGYTENYVKILKYILSDKRLSQRFPGDEEVREKMRTKDIYNFKNKFHIFERIENHQSEEKINAEEFSVEHIMPITLSTQWENDLGDDWGRIHETYVHTIGNLTLTADNSELSNKSFPEKRNIYSESKLFLNAYVKEQEAWGEAQIRERAGLLADVALQIWGSVKADYEDKTPVKNIYSLEDEDSFTGEKISSYQFRGKDTKVKNWKEFYEKICKDLFVLDPEGFAGFLDDDDFTKKAVIISDDSFVLRNEIKISDGLYVEGNHSAESFLALLRMMLDKLDIELSDVTFSLRESESDE